MSADAVQKVAVVRNHNQHTFVRAQIVLQPVHRVQVKVVGRFVQQQRSGISKQCLRQQHAHLLPALQFAHLAFVQFRRHV